MKTLDDAVPALLEVYAACPPLENGQMRCPACPHMTYLEFTVLFDNLQKNLPVDDVKKLIARAPQAVDAVHLACPLLERGFCGAHGGEAVFCRLGEDLSHCGNLSRTRIAEILQLVTDIAAPCHENLTEPYYLNLLNLHCWFAVMFDSGITQPLFVKLRQELDARFDSGRFADAYKNHTRLKEKLDLIDLFFQFNREQRAAEARDCMLKVRDDFPCTGAYYATQAEAYVRFMDELLQVVENKKNNLN